MTLCELGSLPDKTFVIKHDLFFLFIVNQELISCSSILVSVIENAARMLILNASFKSYVAEIVHKYFLDLSDIQVSGQIYSIYLNT